MKVNDKWEKMFPHKIWNVFNSSKSFSSYLHPILCPRILIYQDIIKRSPFSCLQVISGHGCLKRSCSRKWEVGRGRHSGEGGSRQSQGETRSISMVLGKLKTFPCQFSFESIKFHITFYLGLRKRLFSSLYLQGFITASVSLPWSIWFLCILTRVFKKLLWRVNIPPIMLISMCLDWNTWLPLIFGNINR